MLEKYSVWLNITVRQKIMRNRHTIYSLKFALTRRICPLMLFGFMACLQKTEAEPTKHQPRPILGVQRWDMYSGKGATQKQELGYLPGGQAFLKPELWHDRAPFFCRLTKDVPKIDHPANAGPLWFNHPFDKKRLQNAMDQEIRFAHGAGIDFFIYHGPARALQKNGWELLNNLDAHMASELPEAKQMKFVWALYGHEAMNYTRSKVALMMDETLDYIKRPNWQTVLDVRPLIPVLWPDHFREQLASAGGKEAMSGREFVQYIRKRVREAGLNNPYIVGMTVPARSYERAVEWKAEGYDAFSDYAGGYGGAHAERDRSPSYAEATKSMVTHLEKHFVGQPLPSLPPCTSMQYPWPRALDDKTNQPLDKWYHYKWPEKGDMTARIKAMLDLVAAHPKDFEAQAMIMYSWNEHSEGGGLCPTMGEPPMYHPDTRWLDEVATALASWKKEE